MLALIIGLILGSGALDLPSVTALIFSPWGCGLVRRAKECR
jgi:hypothetical protein